jgi:spermidine/putrescine transport system ATP-binding protein
MSVADNVAFGLKMKGMGAADRCRRAGEMLEMVHLSAFADRLPAQLSGGQQQRVALARALAPAPRVLLLDEPLSALDLKLRQAMRVELKQLQEDTAITFVFVTHDQEEALTMSDRIAVMSAGAVQQIGTAREIYEAPVNRFVADFIGETNLLPVSVAALADGMARCVLPGGRTIDCPAAASETDGDTTGETTGAHHLSIRPERVTLTAPGAGHLEATVARTIYLGTDLQLYARLDDGAEMHVRLQNAARTVLPERGARIGLAIEDGAARLLAD